MAKAATYQFFFDYTDPLSCLMELGLRGVPDQAGSAVERVPFEVNPAPNPLLDPGGELFGQRWKRANAEAEALGIVLARPSIVPWTKKAHELAAFAETRECFGEIHEKLFRAYLSEGLDIGRVDVLVAIGREAGLDPMEAKAALDVDQFSRLIAEHRSRAVSMGVSRIPTLLWEDQRVEGYVDRETLMTILASGQEREP